jgi:hypothetical protein
MTSSLVFTSNGHWAIDCPRCRQVVRVDRHGDRFRFKCYGGCTDSELTSVLDPALMLELVKATGPQNGLEGRRLALMNAAKVEPVAIRWTWHKRIPDETVTLLAGREGTGKSQLSALLTADLTRGRLDGHLYGQPADVIIATLEDPAASVAVPRLIATGADLERVHFLQLGGDQTEPLAIPDDLAAIERPVGQVDARLLIVDPLVATLPDKINGHRDQHVRRALAPLADMAERLGLAVLVVLHFNKAAGSDALLRVGGSIAFVAAARSVLAFGYDPEDPDGEQGDRRVLAQPKSNFGPKQRAIRYEVEEHDFDRKGEKISTSRLAFVGECDITAAEFFASHDPDKRSKEDDARDWLIGHLAGGEWHLSADVKEDGERKKHTPRTLQRALHKMVEVLWGSAAVFTVVLLVGVGIGLSAAVKAYSRAEERADAENSVRLTHIAISRAKQQARITRAQIEAKKADAEKRVAEAVGIRRAQNEISRTLTGHYLQYEAIQAQKAVATSGRNNTLIYVPSGSNGVPLTQDPQSVNRLRPVSPK